MLEARLGHRLFTRRRGAPPVLTPDGTSLLERAEALLNASDGLRNERDRQRQRIRLSIGPHLRDTYLKPLLPRLYREQPEISLELLPVIPGTKVQAALDEGEVDLIVYTIAKASEGLFEARAIAEVPTVLVGPPGIRASLEAGTVAMEYLTFILPAPEHLFAEWIERQLHVLGCTPRQKILHIEFPDVIQQMVEDGQGVSILMLEQVAASLAAGRLEIFGPSLPAMQRVIARSRSAPEAARLVEDYMVEAFQEPPPSARRGGIGQADAGRSGK
jgi:DNA-binding transcriptional LysR family regulator